MPMRGLKPDHPLRGSSTLPSSRGTVAGSGDIPAKRKHRRAADVSSRQTPAQSPVIIIADV
jgi:hypothetical protein